MRKATLIQIALIIVFIIISKDYLYAQNSDQVIKLLVEKKLISQNEVDSLKNLTIKKDQKEKENGFGIQTSKLIQLSGYSQIRYESFQETGKIDGTDLRRIRLDFKGAITSDWDYRLQVDFAVAPKILDGYINYAYDDFFKITAGQYKIPFSLENQIADDKSESIERSQVVEALVARSTDVIGNQNGRDIGLQISGSAFGNKGQYLLDYYAGLFNGQGINVGDKNKPKDFSGRIVLHPIKGIDFGGSYYNGYDIWGASTKPQVRSRYGAELKLNYRSLGISSEFISGRDGLITRKGWYALLGYYIIPEKLQPIIKYDSYNPNQDKSGLISDAYTFGLNYFFNNWTKLQVNYTLKREEVVQIANDIFEVQLQIGF